jgi:hypothetical protein
VTRRDKLALLGNRIEAQAQALQALVRAVTSAPAVALPDALEAIGAMAQSLELLGIDVATQAVLDPAGSAG